MTLLLEHRQYLGVIGVYEILCMPTGKIYVGGSEDIGSRLRHHKWKLRHNKHSNVYLQRAWAKHGEDGFAFSVLEVVASAGCLREREQYWLDTKQSYVQGIGFNLERLSTACAKPARPGHSKLSKQWLVTGPDGVMMSVVNLKRFCRERGLSDAVMVLVAQGRWPAHKGWICRLATTSEEEWRAAVASNRKVLGEKRAKTYELTDPSGEVMTVTNLKKFCESRGLSDGLMNSVAAGNRRHHKQWTCRLLEARQNGDAHSG